MENFWLLSKLASRFSNYETTIQINKDVEKELREQSLDHYESLGVLSFGRDLVRKYVQLIPVGTTMVSIGSGNGILENWLCRQFPQLEVICVDPLEEKYFELPMDLKSLGLDADYSTAKSLAEARPDIVGNCCVLLNWPTNNNDYDCESIDVLRPKFVLSIVEYSGGSGSDKLLKLLSKSGVKPFDHYTHQKSRYQRKIDVIERRILESSNKNQKKKLLKKLNKLKKSSKFSYTSVCYTSCVCDLLGVVNNYYLMALLKRNDVSFEKVYNIPSVATPSCQLVSYKNWELDWARVTLPVLRKTPRLAPLVDICAKEMKIKL
jgi:hypothetical protein